MPDGSDWNVRGELSSLPDSMVASETGLQSDGSCVDGGVDSIETADWENGSRDRPWHHHKKNCDLHGGQYGLKSVYWRHRKIPNLEPANQNQQFYVDNKQLDDNEEVDIRAKERIVLVREMDADKDVEKHDGTGGEMTKTGNTSKRRRNKCLKSLYEKQHSTKVRKGSTKESLTKVEKGSTKEGLTKAEKGPTKEGPTKFDKGYTKEGSTSFQKGTTNDWSTRVQKHTTREGSHDDKPDEELVGRKHVSVNYEVNKTQSEKLAIWKVLEMEEVEKKDGEVPEKVKVPELDYTKDNKDSYNVSLTEMDTNKLEDNSQLSCYVEEEETTAKTLDCLAEDVEEKCDSSDKDYVSLGFSVAKAEIVQDLSDSIEESYNGRALEETSWCHSVESMDSTDSGLTKLQSDTETEYSTWDNYEKDRLGECDTWLKGNMKSGVLLHHVDNRDLEEFTLNWLETGHIDWRTSDLKNHYRSFLTKQTGGHEFMDSEKLDLWIQLEIEKLLCSKTSYSLFSTNPQNLDKCLQVDKNVVDKNKAKAPFVSDEGEQNDTVHVADSVDVANSVADSLGVADDVHAADSMNVANSVDLADSVFEGAEVDCDARSSDVAIAPMRNAKDKGNVNCDVTVVLEGDVDESNDTADIEEETERVSDDDSEDILDADEKDSGTSEKKSLCPGKMTEAEVEKDIGYPTAVNDFEGNKDKVPVHNIADEVKSCLDEAVVVDVEYAAVRESGRRKIDSLKAIKLSLPVLYQLQIQAMEIQMKVAKLGVQIGMDKLKLNVVRRNYLLCFDVQDNWDQVSSSRRHTACRYPGTSKCDSASSGSWSGEEQILLKFHTRNQSQGCLARKMPNPKVPNSDKIMPEQDADRRGISLLRYCECVGRQCADKGDSNSGRRNNAGDANSGDKADKNRRNEKEQNSHHSNNNNNNDNNYNNNNNKPSQQTVGTSDVELSLKGEHEQHGRSLHDVQVPDNDYKAYRKKKHKAHEDYQWLEKLNNKLLENGGPSFDLFAVLTNNEDVCLEVCLSRPGDISAEAMNCTMCLLIDSLLKHFTNCHSNFNSCDMCVKFFSLLCSHVTLCISRNGTVECDIDICRTVIKMLPSTNLESHVKTLWFQVRKKFARIIGIVELEEQVQVVEVHQEKPVIRKPSLVRKPSGSGPLPSIPEMSVIPSATFSNSAVIRRRISQMRVHGEADSDEDDVHIETVDAGATGNTTNDDQTGSEASSISRPEMCPDSDAMPTSSEEGSMEDSSGHSAVGKGFVSLPPAGPPCVGDTYFPSFQDRPRGIRGIGEVVYADRNQMLVVVTVWEKFKTQFQREAKLAKHYREEGVILSKFKNKLKINQLRYQTDFQWVKSAHLGNGMTGKCHLAMDFETEFKFCVKEIHISNYEKDEIELMSALDHEYIVQVYGAIRHAEKIYILQEFIEGGCLTEAINIQKKLGRRLSQLTALRYFEQLLKVLVYLKKCNILNEDIKADNILLDRHMDDSRSGPSSIKVTDFGMARRCQGSVPSGTKPAGTQTQWSPEKAEAVGYGYPAELWAAVCVLVHMLSGLPPWVRRFEEMKALILVIVDKSPPMEDIPRNILETIQDLIRRGFTVCQGQRPTAEELLNHPAFQLLGENSNPNGTGIYSILESVHYPSHSIAEATNSIEDDPSADKRELHRKGLVDYEGASKSGIPNLGLEIPAQELSIFPAAPSNGNSGAASGVGNDANNGSNTSIENKDIRYELLLLSQSQNEQDNNSQTPVSAQPSQMVTYDPFHSYLYDESPVNQNLPALSIYAPNMIDDGREIGESKPELITEDDATAKLIPDFEKLFASGENSSSYSAGEEKAGEDWRHDPDQALEHVIRRYTSPGSTISPSGNHGDKVQAVSGGNIGGSGDHADSTIVGGRVGQSGENEDRVIHGGQDGGSGENVDRVEHGGQVGSSDEDEEIIESLSSNFDENDLFSTGPTENVTKRTKRKTQSDTGLWHLPKESKTRNQPQSAPPKLISTDSRVSGSRPSSANNHTPVQSDVLAGTGSHTVDALGRPYNVVHSPYSMPYTHHSPRNSAPCNPPSMMHHGMQNYMTSTPIANNQQMGTRPKHTVYPRELFPGEHNIPRPNPTGPDGRYQFYTPTTNSQHPPGSLDYHMPRQNPASYGGGYQYYYQSMHVGPPPSVSEQQTWGTSYRKSKIDQLQPKTPILNPVINPKAWPTQDGPRIPNLQLDIKKAREGTDSPISHVQTAPAFSPPKTPKKSPDLYRAQSEVPTASKKHSSVSTVLGSSPNDQLSTSTTRSQFEEQEALFKELGRTAEDALSQHSDPVHWQVYGFHDEECDDQNQFMGELDNEIIDDPAESCAHLFDDVDENITITFRSDVNQHETRMKFTSRYFNQSWRNIIKEALDGFSRHDMPREYGLTRFNLKLENGDFIDLDHSLGDQSQVLIMTEAMDNDPWWIERGMIY